jgi:RHS repeat-associated protein
MTAWTVIVSMFAGYGGCSSFIFKDINVNKHFPSPGEPSGRDVLSSSTNMSGKEEDTSPKLDPLSGAVYLPPPQIGNYGSVSFSYPLSVPASRAFKPSVGLSYSSSGSDGLCGIGWSLSTGLGVISRTTANGELYYDYRDTFTFNGKRLVKTGGPAASEDGTYRCEIESDFSRFEMRNSSSGGVWYVYDKSGAVTVLGETTDSRIYRPDDRSGTYIWNFTRSYDLNGNTVRAVYDTTAYNRNHVLYLSEIRYGGNNKTGLNDLQWIKFSYKDREDAYVSKSPGFIMKMDRFLDAISVGWDDPRAFLFTSTELWNYTLVYETSEDSERPLLVSVNSSKHTTSPRFVYQKANHSLSWQKISNIWSGDAELDPQKTRYFEGDFNGDGLSDMLFFNPENGLWRCAECTRTGGYLFKTYGSAYQGYSSDDKILFFKGNVTGDYNGDGRSDVAFYLPETREFIVAEGNGKTLTFRSYGVLPSYVSDIFSCEWFCGDYDGNGLSDVFLFDEKAGKWTLMLNKGGSFEFRVISTHLKNLFRSDYTADANLDSKWTMDDSQQGNARSKVHFLSGDYNGDGRTDISIYDERSGDWLVSTVSRSSAGVYSMNWTKYGQFKVPGDLLFGNDRFSGDFNGDGFSDFLWYDRSGGYWWIGETGIQSINFRKYAKIPDGIRAGSGITRWLQGDFNGDGKTDIGFYSASDGNFWIGEASNGGFRFRIYTNISYGGPDGARVLAAAPLPNDEVTVMNASSVVKQEVVSVITSFPYDGNTSETSGEKVFSGSFSAENKNELLVFSKKTKRWTLVAQDGTKTQYSNNDADISQSGGVILNHERPQRLSNGSVNVDMLKYAVKNSNGDINYYLIKIDNGGTTLKVEPIGKTNTSMYAIDISKSVCANETGSAAVMVVNDKPKEGEEVKFLRFDGNAVGEYAISVAAGNESTAETLKSLLANTSDTEGKIRMFSMKDSGGARVYICDTASGTWYKGVFGSGAILFTAISGSAAWNADESQGALAYEMWNDGVNDCLVYGTKKNGALSFYAVKFTGSGLVTQYSFPSLDCSWDKYFDHAHRPVVRSGDAWKVLSLSFADGSKQFLDVSNAGVTAYSFTRSDLYQDIYPFNWIQGDYNGDGKTDVGFFHLKESQWYYAVTKGTVPDMISGVKNGIGGTYTFEYANSTSFDNTGGDGVPDLPMNYKVCTRMVVEDGCGRSVSRTYEYKNGCAYSAFVNGKKETDYFGFSEFTARDVLGGRTVSTYNTMPYDDFRKNRALSGAVKETRVYGTDGVEYSRTENEYTLHEIVASPLSPLPGREGNASGAVSFLIEPTKVRKYAKGTLSETRTSNITLESGKYELVSKSESVTDHYSDAVHPSVTLLGESFFTYNETTNETRLSYAKKLSGSANETRTDYEYDARGNMTRETTSYTGSGLSKPKDRVIRYEYDDYGNKTRSVNESGKPGRVTETDYDDALHQYPVKERAIGPVTLETTYTINYASAFGAADSRKDPNGNGVYYEYDGYGRLLRQKLDTDKGVETLAEYEYTPSVGIGHAYSLQSAKCTQYTGDGGKKETRVYADGMGRALHSVWSATTESGKKYAKSGRITYDAIGRVTRKGQTIWASDGEIDTYYAAEEKNPTLTEYDGSGRVAKVTLPPAYDGEAATYTSYSYNDPWESTVMHSIGRSKRTVKNASGLVLYIEDSGVNDDGSGVNASIGFAYDIAGNRIKKMDTNGTAMNGEIDNSLFAPGKKDMGGNAVCQWRYDGFGQLIETSDPDLGYARAEYDGFGEVVKRTDAKGLATVFEYDSLGRLTKKTLPGNEGVVAYYYDAAAPLGTSSSVSENSKGKLTGIDDPSQGKSLSYDKTGRVKHEERVITGKDTVYATDFSYDLLNRTKTIAYPEDPVSGTRITANYRYCAYGVSDIEADGLIVGKTLVKNIRYNEFGQMTYLERGNGTDTAWDYDIRGRLTHIETKRGSEQIQNISYAFRIDNSISSREDSTGENESARKVRYEYSYDGLNRLADAKGSYFEGTDATKAKTYAHTYGYFPNGNIRQKTAAEKGETWTYGYEGHAVTGVKSGMASKYTMRYDESGNMSEQTDMTSGLVKRMEYDSSNRQVRAREGDKTVGEYAYDDQGFRVHKIAAEIIDGADTKVEVLYPSMYFAIEKQKSSDGQDIPNTAYAANNVYLNGVRIAVLTSDKKAQYYLIDQVDSVNAVLDDDGKTVDRFEYEEYGAVWQSAGEGKNRPKYGSAEYDEETKLYYMNARYQNPELGRFTTADTVIPNDDDTQGWNRYSYCNNNPVRYKDPTGHDPRSAYLANQSNAQYLKENDYEQPATYGVQGHVGAIQNGGTAATPQAKKLQKAPDSGSVPGRISGPILSNEAIATLAEQILQGPDGNGTQILKDLFPDKFETNAACPTNALFLGLAKLGKVNPSVEGYKEFMTYAAEKGYINPSYGGLIDGKNLAADYGAKLSYVLEGDKTDPDKMKGRMEYYKEALKKKESGIVFIVRDTKGSHVAASMTTGDGTDFVADTANWGDNKKTSQLYRKNMDKEKGFQSLGVLQGE